MIILWPFQILSALIRIAPEFVASLIWALGLDICIAWLMMGAVRLWHAVRP
jgi:hypothetical protein